MTQYELVVDLHKGRERQGPGSHAYTKEALRLSGLGLRPGILNIADLGCGTGASTLILAEYLNAQITAVDLSPEFLDILASNAQAKGFGDFVDTLECSIDKLPFEANSLDAIWSEGAVYNIGFPKAVSYFKTLLKKGGVLAVSEINWLAVQRPKAISDHWAYAYPEMTTPAQNLITLEQEGFILLGYFALPSNCWLENYYIPLEKSFVDFLVRHGNSTEARAVVHAEMQEIILYKKYQDYYSYGFYIAQKI